MKVNHANKKGNFRLVLLPASFILLAIALNMAFSSIALALDPPANIRLDGGRLSWDEVPSAGEYHLYYFDGPIPSATVVGNYVTVTGGTSWSLDVFNEPFGYYTVVAVRTDERSMPLEFSAVTDGGIVAYLDPTESSASEGSRYSVVVNEQRCNNVVAGESCTATCSATTIPTGGACRADAGVSMHQRALQNGYQCLTQQDVSFVEADVYCLSVMSE